VIKGRAWRVAPRVWVRIERAYYCSDDTLGKTIDLVITDEGNAHIILNMVSSK